MTQFKLVDENLRKTEKAYLPLRGTKTSAGYDFFATEDIAIEPQGKAFFWTDVCVDLEDDEVLLLDVRSSIGTKQDLMLANTIPVIDSDYINAPNGGNIGIMLRNLKPSMKLDGYYMASVNIFCTKDGENVLLDEDGKQVTREAEITIPVITSLKTENTIYISKGERVCQGIILKYVEADNCNSTTERTGGFGSTNK